MSHFNRITSSHVLFAGKLAHLIAHSTLCDVSPRTEDVVIVVPYVGQLKAMQEALRRAKITVVMSEKDEQELADLMEGEFLQFLQCCIIRFYSYTMPGTCSTVTSLKSCVLQVVQFH